MGGRNHSLDYLRLLLSAVVVLYHARTLAGQDPVMPWLLSPTFAVQAFFVISGMLIFSALDREPTIEAYLARRFWRIYPAYAVVVVIAALCLVRDFDSALLGHVAANLALANFLAPDLPGVFAGNPETAINGSLWTIKVEVTFYVLAPILVVLGRRLGLVRLLSVIATVSAVWHIGFMVAGLGRWAMQFPGQLVFFCVGGLIHHLKMTWRPIALPPLSADYSFGLYLVHFPIIQLLVASGIHREPHYLPLAFALSFAGAFLIWHMVERPVQVWRARANARRRDAASAATLA